jgi:hypothetical protein
MTVGDGMSLGTLLDRAMIDPLALVERILQQALDQLTRQDGLAAGEGQPPQELVATALGNRLAQLISSGNPSTDALPSKWQHADEVIAYENLVDRNSVLAAAVGACDCWGEQIDCRLCGGYGVPGWVLPDKELFARYVYPAVSAVSEREVPQIKNGASRRTKNQRKEIRHAEHLAR